MSECAPTLRLPPLRMAPERRDALYSARLWGAQTASRADMLDRVCRRLAKELLGGSLPPIHRHRGDVERIRSM